MRAEGKNQAADVVGSVATLSLSGGCPFQRLHLQLLLACTVAALHAQCLTENDQTHMLFIIKQHSVLLISIYVYNRLHVIACINTFVYPLER